MKNFLIKLPRNLFFIATIIQIFFSGNFLVALFIHPDILNDSLGILATLWDLSLAILLVVISVGLFCWKKWAAIAAIVVAVLIIGINIVAFSFTAGTRDVYPLEGLARFTPYLPISILIVIAGFLLVLQRKQYK